MEVDQRIFHPPERPHEHLAIACPPRNGAPPNKDQRVGHCQCDNSVQDGNYKGLSESRTQQSVP